MGNTYTYTARMGKKGQKPRFDEKLEAIKTAARKVLIESRESLREQNKKKVLNSLLKSYFARDKDRQGRSVPELIEGTGLARKTVYNILYENLIKDGFVVKLGNKRGKYYLTSKALKDPTLRAHLFAMESVKRLLNPTNLNDIFRTENISTSKASKFCNNNKIARNIIERGRGLRKSIMEHNESEFQNQNYEQIQNYVKSQIPRSQIVDEIALALFEFGNRIGFFVTYTLLQALNPEHVPSSVVADRTVLRDGLSLNWVDNAIRPRELLMEFINQWFISSRLRFQKDIAIQENTANNTDTYSVFEMDISDFDELVTAFNAAYPPKYYQGLEHIRKNAQKKAFEARDIREMREKGRMNK